MTTATQQPHPPFSTHARAVVRAVRGAFSELVLAAGADPQTPQSLSHRLGLNKNLAWKISKIVQTDDPSVVLQQMPGSSGIRIFLKSARKAGVDAELVSTAEEAVRGYERLIDLHSGDRATLEMMGSELSESGRHQRDEQHRKMLYQGASYVWGAQARVNLKIGLVGPGRETGLLDFASLNGLIDFRRLRPDVTWVMASRTSYNDDGTQMATAATEAIDPRYKDATHAPLMADFCSHPLPELRRFVDGSLLRYELIEGPVGNTGSLTCVVGTIQRDMPYFRTPNNDWGAHLAKSNIPAELMILDMFFHEQFDFALPPEFALYSEMASTVPQEQRDRYRLPLHEPLQDLGVDALPPATPEVPKYSRMLQQMFERMGWSPSEFHGYRIKVPYPPYPTSVIVRYRLPDAPQ